VFVPDEIALIKKLGLGQSIIIGKNILGARINEPLPPDAAIAGVPILESVVPKVIAAVPVPVFRMATRYARVGVLGISCRAADAAVVRSNRKVGERIFRESMIILVIEMFKLSYVFRFLHHKNKKKATSFGEWPFQVSCGIKSQ
jgi:hypothetical protein